MNVYDLSFRLTQLCQNDKLSDVSRGKIEYLAGEVILCYEQIKEGILKPKKQIITAPSSLVLPGQMQRPAQFQYVDLN